MAYWLTWWPWPFDWKIPVVTGRWWWWHYWWWYGIVFLLFGDTLTDGGIYGDGCWWCVIEVPVFDCNLIPFLYPMKAIPTVWWPVFNSLTDWWTVIIHSVEGDDVMVLVLYWCDMIFDDCWFDDESDDHSDIYSVLIHYSIVVFFIMMTDYSDEGIVDRDVLLEVSDCGPVRWKWWWCIVEGIDEDGDDWWRNCVFWRKMTRWRVSDAVTGDTLCRYDMIYLTNSMMTWWWWYRYSDDCKLPETMTVCITADGRRMMTDEGVIIEADIHYWWYPLRYIVNLIYWYIDVLCCYCSD